MQLEYVLKHNRSLPLDTKQSIPQLLVALLQCLLNSYWTKPVKLNDKLQGTCWYAVRTLHKFYIAIIVTMQVQIHHHSKDFRFHVLMSQTTDKL